MFLLAASLAEGASRDQGELNGRVSVEIDVTLDELGPVAVYLEALDEDIVFPKPKRTLRIVQKDAEFQPGFVVAAVGQSVEMPNADAFYHNVFSYARPNDFDLGLYPKGEARVVILQHPGVVRIYCSIHETMRGVILVAPTPWFDEVALDGSFRIRGIPPGDYRLWAFNERLPKVSRVVRIVAGETLNVALGLGGDADGE